MARYSAILNVVRKNRALPHPAPWHGCWQSAGQHDAADRRDEKQEHLNEPLSLVIEADVTDVGV